MLPDSVDILGVRYAVVEEDAAAAGAELYDKHGLIDDLQCRIRIPKRGPNDLAQRRCCTRLSTPSTPRLRTRKINCARKMWYVWPAGW